MNPFKFAIGAAFLIFTGAVYYFIGKFFMVFSGFLGLLGFEAFIAVSLLITYLSFCLVYGREILNKYLFQSDPRRE